MSWKRPASLAAVGLALIVIAYLVLPDACNGAKADAELAVKALSACAQTPACPVALKDIREALEAQRLAQTCAMTE